MTEISRNLGPSLLALSNASLTILLCASRRRALLSINMFALFALQSGAAGMQVSRMYYVLRNMVRLLLMRCVSIQERTQKLRWKYILENLVRMATMCSVPVLKRCFQFDTRVASITNSISYLHVVNVF